MPPRFNRTAKTRLARFHGPILGNVQRLHPGGQIVLVIAKEPRAAGIVAVAISPGDIRQIYGFGRGKPLEPAFGVGKFQVNYFHRRNLRRMEQVQTYRSGPANHLQTDSFNFRGNAHRTDRDDFKPDNLSGWVNRGGQSGGPVKERATFQQILGFLLQLLFLDELLDRRVDSVNGQMAHKVGKTVIRFPIGISVGRFGTGVVGQCNPHNAVVLYLCPGLIRHIVFPLGVFVQIIVRHNRPDIGQRNKRVRTLERQPAFTLAQRIVYLVLWVVILLPTDNRQQRRLYVLQSYHFVFLF